MVLSCGSDHRWPTDVYHLDEFLIASRWFPGSCLLEGVEVDANQIDPSIAEIGQGVHVIVRVPSDEYPPVDSGVEGFDPAIENLRVTCDLGYVGDFDSSIPQLRGRPPCGDYLPIH